MIRRHYYFSGTVQGVGFRFRCQTIAASLGLTGWCKNLFDGRVEAEVQGEAMDVNQFVLRLSKEPFISIENIEEKDIPISKNEKSFKVRFY
jgi:acylphosphatase